MSIQCQADKWWELRKISIRWLLLNPTPNSPNWHRKNCMAFSKRSWSERVKSLTITNNNDGYGKNNSDKWELTFTAVCRKVVGKMKKCMWQSLKVIWVSSDQWILIETDKSWQIPTCMWIWEEQTIEYCFLKYFSSGHPEFVLVEFYIVSVVHWDWSILFTFFIRFRVKSQSCKQNKFIKPPMCLP